MTPIEKKAYITPQVVVETSNALIDPVSLDFLIPPVSTIIGSFYKDKIIELCELNKHRNSYAYSIGTYDVDNHGFLGVNRGYGEFSYNKLDNNPNFYTIVYLQSTPCGRNVQPASTIDRHALDHGFEEYYLWLHGNLTAAEIQKLQIEEDTEEQWETMLLLKHVVRYEAPADVDGSFSCVYSDGEDLYLFRNELESMFVDDELNICTMPFKGSRATSANKMILMNLEKKTLKITEPFDTVKHWV